MSFFLSEEYIVRQHDTAVELGDAGLQADGYRRLAACYSYFAKQADAKYASSKGAALPMAELKKLEDIDRQEEEDMQVSSFRVHSEFIQSSFAAHSQFIHSS